MKAFLLIFTILLVGFASCKKSTTTPTGDDVSTPPLLFDVTHNPTNLYLDTINFKANKSSHFEITPTLDETSGIISSITNPNLFWLHEDSGNNANLYLYNNHGKRIKRYTLKNVSSIDYEDISAGYGQNNQLNHILIGDIGDNNTARTNIAIFRFPEPNYAADPTPEGTISAVEKLTLTYPQIDGVAQKENAEAFFVDPISQDLFLFTKESSACKVMTVKSPLPFGETVEMVHLGNINFRFQKITAADISHDGKHVLLKSYDYMYYWHRAQNQPLNELFLTTPIRLPYEAEAQGEAVCWLNQGTQYLTISELKNGVVPALNLYNQ